MNKRVGQQAVMNAAALIEQRRHGRHLGGPVHVDWDGSGDYDVVTHATWAEREGPKNNVFIHRVKENSWI